MENKLVKLFKLDRLFDSISGYLETRLNLFKLEAKEEIAEITSKGIQAVLIVFVFSFAILFFSLSLSIFLGIWLDHYGLGFLIMGAVYLLLGIIVYLLRGRMGIKQRINHYLGNNIEEEDE